MFQILVVEDDKNTARLMRAVLTRAGYEVHTAENGEKAMAVTDRQHIDLTVLDVMMPVMDGYEFARQLRAAGDTTPPLMVTAKELPEERCEGFWAGTDDYMVKPVNEEEMLRQVWLNLLDNAVKFSPSGGKITIRVKPSGEGVAVKISDEGIGMSPETKKHIFDKFYQGDRSHATGGNGLGLSIAKKIVDLHGGHITVRSSDKGSTFEVLLKSVKAAEG